MVQLCPRKDIINPLGWYNCHTVKPWYNYNVCLTKHFSNMEGFRDIAWQSSITAHFELFTSNKVNMLKELRQALFKEAQGKWLVCEGD